MPSNRELVNERMDGRLASFLARERTRGIPVREIVWDIYGATDILVTERTVWRWINELTQEVAEP